MEESNPSLEILLVYSTAPAEWVIGIFGLEKKIDFTYIRWTELIKSTKNI